MWSETEASADLLIVSRRAAKKSLDMKVFFDLKTLKAKI